MSHKPEGAVSELAAALRAAVIPLGRALRSTDSALTPTQLSVLGAIYRNQPVTIGDLAERERLSPAMISRVVTALVDEGLVERIPDQWDRRVCRVRVSDVGHRWINKTRTQRNSWLAGRLSELSAEQRQTLAAAVPLLEVLASDENVLRRPTTMCSCSPSGRPSPGLS